ncbi:unnamed protein product [Cuscuta europaea]|uniref:Uncharacterized protein n=1 Tax=Cuscuta europaea TaxID=41803 RepID=A0A9P0Z158_CUSEU|nr:unnamed protein product [Cuscuta europaea]
MAARIIAQLIVMGSGIMARAFVQAYRQALMLRKRGLLKKWPKISEEEAKSWQKPRQGKSLVSRKNQRGKRSCRNMITCLRKMQRAGASIFNQKSIEQKNV